MCFMAKSSISIDLGDPRTGLVAEALSNKTCVKILDLLAEDELTASDIAFKLDIPLNTVGYNIDKLIVSGLVEKSSNFFWSVKGKKTPTYKVANRKIVISPKRIIKGIVPLLLVAGVIALFAIGFVFDDSTNVRNGLSNNLKQFSSYEELAKYVKDANSISNNGYGRGGADTLTASMESGAPRVAGASAFADKSGSASTFSGTNIQVAGVDELDIVKNDGKYIYTVNQNKVVIVDAYPANSMKIVSELEFDNSVNGIFVDDGKLIVIESSYGYYGLYGGAELDKVAVDSIMPPQPSVNDVRIHVYDVSSDEIGTEWELIETFVMDGNYYSARLIDGVVYIIGNKYIDSSSISIPFFKSGDEVKNIDASSVYYPGYYQSNLVFTSVMAINLENLDYEGDVFLTGTNTVIYVSENAIYLTSQKSYDYTKVDAEALKVIVDQLPGEFGNRAQDVIDSDYEHYVRYDKISQIMQEYFNKLSAVEKKDFEEKLAKANERHYIDVSKRYERTIIHKINIDGLDISYSGTSDVPGYILNQFSMDEFEGNFRIATTTGGFSGIGNSLNHLYVLDSDLEIIGSVEDIAPGERIYSARFVGDKAYMVTFRQVDPLYVIDLSSLTEPEILGFLKVTGFSNYLQPIGENLLLGIGREASEEGRSQGLKISLFDVSDFSNPREIDKYVVESDWSYSEAEYEHKAVLFDDALDLLVIPVTYSQQLGQKWEYWQGAFAFTVTDTDISLKGKIDHDKKDAKVEDNYRYGSGYVQRSLFMDDILYTVSSQMIKANAVSDLTEISFVELPFESPIYTIY